MRHIAYAAAFALIAVPASVLAAGDGKVTISSPPDGAAIDAKSVTSMKYDVVPGTDGDHVHLMIDGKRVSVIHELKGSVDIDPLPPGAHKICLQVNTKSHTPTGTEGCINVTSK